MGSVRANTHGLLGATVAVLSGAVAHAEIPCGYEVTAIIQGPLCEPFGYPPMFPQDIAEDGTVVGYYWACVVGPSRPFRWTPSGGFETLDLPDGFTEAEVFAIDEQTGWLVGRVFAQGSPLPTAAVWIDGEPMTLGTLPGGNPSEAFASAGGRIVGKWGNSVSGPIQAFLWQDGVMNDLGPDLATPSGEARAVNDAGQVAGWMGQSFTTDAHAFIWQDGVVTDLGPIPGGFTSAARGLNDGGEVVGLGRMVDPSTGDETTRAFFWDGVKMTNLGTLPGHSHAAAADVNEDGVVVGTASGPVLANGFVWSEGMMVNLNELLRGDGGVFVDIARAINSGGQIAARGENSANDVVVLVLTPVEPVTGDLNCDQVVDELDFFALILAWGQCPANSACAGDLDGDGAVGIVDLLILLANWG